MLVVRNAATTVGYVMISSSDEDVNKEEYLLFLSDKP